MTDEQLAEIEARVNATTPGPWYDHTADDDVCMTTIYVSTSPRCDDIEVDEHVNNHGEVIALMLYQYPRVVDHTSGLWTQNAAFIAHARADVLALVAEVRRLKAENAQLREQVEALDPDVIFDLPRGEVIGYAQFVGLSGAQGDT